jgi:hypothetical protein
LTIEKWRQKKLVLQAMEPIKRNESPVQINEDETIKVKNSGKWNRKRDVGFASNDFSVKDQHPKNERHSALICEIVGANNLEIKRKMKDSHKWSISTRAVHKMEENCLNLSGTTLNRNF